MRPTTCHPSQGGPNSRKSCSRKRPTFLLGIHLSTVDSERRKYEGVFLVMTKIVISLVNRVYSMNIYIIAPLELPANEPFLPIKKQTTYCSMRNFVVVSMLAIRQLHQALFYSFQFGYEGCCSTYHTTQYLGLECPAVALSLTTNLSSKGMVF